MQKITKSHSEYLKRVTLYLDDLEMIVSIIRDGPVADTIEIRTDDYEFDSIEDLANLKTKALPKLRISSSKPHVSLTIEPNHVWLYISDDSSIQRGIFEKLKSYLADQTSPLAWLTDSTVMSGVPMGLGVALSILAYKEKNIYLFLLGPCLLILGLTYFWWVFTGIYKRIPVWLIRKGESTNFLKRKKDDILLAIIFAAVGAIITFMITKAFS